MFNSNDFDSRVLLKLLLNPDSILKNNETVRVEPSDSMIHLDVLKILQDNLMESSMNPAYISEFDVRDAVQYFNGLVANENNFNSLKKIIKYCTKMCLLDCMFLKTRVPDNIVPNYTVIRIVPTMQFLKRENIKHISDFQDVDSTKLFILSDIDNLIYIFNFLKIDENEWKQAVFGYVFSEFPTIVNQCKRTQVTNIIADSDSDSVILYLMRVLYLMMRYDLYTILDTDSEQFHIKEVATNDTLYTK